MMRPTSKKSGRTRTSKRFCEEKFCCSVVDAEASFICTECKTTQCSDCEKSIHSVNRVKYEFHTRRRLDPPQQELLCNGNLSGASCVNRNYADQWCEDCKQKQCFDCYNESHSQGKRKTHHRISIREHQKREEEKQKQERTFLETVKPLSPVTDNDDSLTYLSCPQEQLEPYEAENTSMSFASFHSDHSLPSAGSIPDICQDSAAITKELEGCLLEDERYSNCHSFVLANEEESLQIDDEHNFVEKLGCKPDTMVKVVSIFGNTGDGKSHTLNHTFFGGKEVFHTSPEQVSCTIGIWAAFDPENSAIIIDTEGLLGVSSNQNQRTRLLLKVLAISDVVIYRTRAERLHSDMFNFLSDASKAYLKHFSGELQAAAKKYKLDLQSVSNLGPAIVIFQETLHTDALGHGQGSIEAALRGKFKDFNCTIDAFSDLRYVGTRTQNPPTDFTRLQKVIKEQLANSNIRAPRKPEIVFQTLKVLNEKFSGDIEKPVPNTFPDQYFTCNSKCLACHARCTRSMNHNTDELPHETEKTKHCHYQHQYGNKIYLCKKCMLKGSRKIVVPKTSAQTDNTWIGLGMYLWSGYVLECDNCGIIYRSRQYWYGNQEVETIVHMEVTHIWPEGNMVLDGTHNAARKVLDSLHVVADTIGSVGAKPTKLLSEWTADQIAPSYWVPNSKINDCTKCHFEFTQNDQKHHCRVCGNGFCDDCSKHKRPVPEKGWGSTPVRVCDLCIEVDEAKGGETTVTARMIGEVFSSTCGAVASAIDYPLGILKDSARPAYWVPDEKITECFLCKVTFSYKVTKHHCRACGQGVCSDCSPNKLPVPLRGWDYPVRVCKKCERKKDKL